MAEAGCCVGSCGQLLSLFLLRLRLDTARSRHHVLNPFVQVLEQHFSHRHRNIVISFLEQFPGFQLVVNFVLLTNSVLALKHNSVFHSFDALPVASRERSHLVQRDA